MGFDVDVVGAFVVVVLVTTTSCLSGRVAIDARDDANDDDDRECAEQCALTPRDRPQLLCPHFDSLSLLRDRAAGHRNRAESRNRIRS